MIAFLRCKWTLELVLLSSFRNKSDENIFEIMSPIQIGFVTDWSDDTGCVMILRIDK